MERRHPSSSGRLEFVDTLRALAILMVIVAYMSLAGAPRLLFLVLQQGTRGVQLFFMASAFTLFLSLANRIKREVHPIRNFYIRRVFRILPGFYAFMLFYAISAVLLPDLDRMTGYATRTVIGFISTLFPFVGAWIPAGIDTLVPGGWSIAVEMAFYVIMPLIFFLVRDLRASAIFVVFSVVLNLLTEAYLLRPIAHLVGDQFALRFIFLWLPSQLPYFALGIMFYYWYQAHTNDRLMGPMAFFVRFGLPFLAIIVVLLVVVFQRHPHDFYHAAVANFKRPLKFAYGVLFLFLMIWLAVRPPKFLVNRVMRWIGTVSFSAYLTHFLVVDAISSLFRNTNYLVGLFVALPLAIAITIGFSSLVYRLLELPTQAMGKRLIERLEHVSVPKFSTQQW